MGYELDRLNERLDRYMEHWYAFTVEERVQIVHDHITALRELDILEIPHHRVTEMADFLLMDELTNAHPDKVARTEYPILTGKQILRRQRKTVLSGEEATVDYLNIKYNNWKNGSSGANIHKRITADKRA